VSLFGDWLWPEPLCGIKEKHYFSPVTLRARTCGCGVYKRPNPHVKDLEKIKSIHTYVPDLMPEARV